MKLEDGKAYRNRGGYRVVVEYLGPSNGVTPFRDFLGRRYAEDGTCPLRSDWDLMVEIVDPVDAKQEAIAQADAYLSNVNLPTYTKLAKDVADAAEAMALLKQELAVIDDALSHSEMKPLGTLLITTAIGTATNDDAEYEMLMVNANTPAIRSRQTSKYATFSWETLLKLAILLGVDEE